MISSKKGNKVSRVKVAVRCRPAFQDEIEFAKGEFFSIVEVKREEPQSSKLGQISLMTMSGKTRDFYFDYGFGEETTQDQVYDRLARPVVSEVLKGCNGTIFAYGQTGTGKTYTMGILDFVNNEHAGLIPRATHQIFEYIQRESNADINVSVSFLQLYRETIQDLLSPANSSPGGNEENLAIREDPVRGFYVEGLQEFSVRSYGEAEALINLGLENRAIAPTLMNATSSRSHIVLTITIEQKIYGEGTNYTKTLRSKLLMVDLAGSERVRRTISKGTRLSEAKSINTSLSALGNVIAALAEQNAIHIPYRDSKLTRLLQDSLGGTASTALIATIGPAAVNYGETLSTLLFAQRCMAVKITPIPHEEVDYAEMCAKLQAQINSMEGTMTEKLLAQQEQYETTIRSLNQQLEEERLRFQQHEYETTMNGHQKKGTNNGNNQSSDSNEENFNQELYTILSYLEKFDHEEGEWIESSWLRKPSGWSTTAEENINDLPNSQLVTLLAYCYELIKFLSKEFTTLIDYNLSRDETMKLELEKQFIEENTLEQDRHWERNHMYLNDPRRLFLLKKNIKEEEHPKIGSHLAPLSKLEALTRVEAQFRSNNLPISQFDREVILPSSSNVNVMNLQNIVLESLFQYDSIQDIAVSMIHMRSYFQKTIRSIHTILERKDYHYQHVKDELTNQLVEKRKREEGKIIIYHCLSSANRSLSCHSSKEVINWSYILKYLLASGSKLRKELNQEKRIQSKIAKTMMMSSQRGQSESKNDPSNLPFSPPLAGGTGLEDVSMQSDFDKVSLNESIIHRLEHTLLSQNNNNNNSVRGNKNSERNFVPFTQVQAQLPPRSTTNQPLRSSLDDETTSMTSDAPRIAPKPQPQVFAQQPQLPQQRGGGNNEALERVKLRLQMTKEELKNDHHPGPQPPKPHPQLASQYPQRSNSIDSQTSMSKLFNPTGIQNSDDFHTPFDYSNDVRGRDRGVGGGSGAPSVNSQSQANTLTSNNNNSQSQSQARRSSALPISQAPPSLPLPASQPRYVTHNQIEDEEEDQGDYDDERFSLDDSEYSLTSTTRSFRSAATPNSIPLPRYRKSRKKEVQRVQQQAQTMYRRDEEDYEEEYDAVEDDRLRQRQSHQQQQHPPSLMIPRQQRQPSPLDRVNQRGGPSPGISLDAGNLSASSKGPRQHVATNAPPNLRQTSSSNVSANPISSNTVASSGTPSQFAQEIVRNLGVQGTQALSVMSVIDRVKDITPEQLALLDEETRNEIITIRKDLGIDEYMLSNEQRRVNAEMNHIQRTRSSSNPRSMRSEGGNSSRPTSVSRSVSRSTTPNNNVMRSSYPPPEGRQRERSSSRDRQSNASGGVKGRMMGNQSPGRARPHPALSQSSSHGRYNRYDEDDYGEEEEEGFSQLDLMYRK